MHSGQQMDASRVGRVKERVQDVPCAPTVRKYLAVGLLVERHLEPAEEFNGVRGGERPQNASDDGAAAPPEITLGHHAVRHVTPPSPADQDLRARALGAIEQQHGPGGVRAASEDRRRKSRGARPDDRDVSGRDAVAPRHGKHVILSPDAQRLWSSCRHRHTALLRARRSFSKVRAGLRRRMPGLGRLRLSPGRLAVWCDRDCLDRCRRPALVGPNSLALRVASSHRCLFCRRSLGSSATLVKVEPSGANVGPLERRENGSTGNEIDRTGIVAFACTV